MAFVSAAAEQLQTALTGRPPNIRNASGLPSTQMSDKQSGGLSVQDIANSLFQPVGDLDQYGVATNTDTVVMKPTDVMRHKAMYNRNSANHVLQFAGVDDNPDDDDVKHDGDGDEPVVSNITVDQYNFDRDNEVDLNVNSAGVEEEEETKTPQPKKKEDLTMVNEDTEKYLDSLLDEEMHADNEKP